MKVRGFQKQSRCSLQISFKIVLLESGRKVTRPRNNRECYLNEPLLSGRKGISLLSMAEKKMIFRSHIFYWRKIIGVHTTCGNALELHRSTLKPKGWMNADVLVPPIITKLMDGYCPELELQFYYCYFIKVSNSKSTKVQWPKVYTSFRWLWRKTWTLLLKL